MVEQEGFQPLRLGCSGMGALRGQHVDLRVVGDIRQHFIGGIMDKCEDLYSGAGAGTWREGYELQVFLRGFDR
jgi:hypothetical protein